MKKIKLEKHPSLACMLTYFFTDLFYKSLNNGRQKQNQVPQSYQPLPVSVSAWDELYPSGSVYNIGQEHAMKWICPIIMTTSGALEQSEVLCHLFCLCIETEESGSSERKQHVMFHQHGAEKQPESGAGEYYWIPRDGHNRHCLWVGRFTLRDLSTVNKIVVNRQALSIPSWNSNEFWDEPDWKKNQLK